MLNITTFTSMKSINHSNWLTLILILGFYGNSFAQQYEGDEFRLKILKETKDTSRIKLLIQYGINYCRNDEEQDSCFGEIYELSKRNKFLHGLAFYHYHAGLLLSRTGKYDEAIEEYKRCIDGLDSLGIVQPSFYPLSTIRSLFNATGKQTEKFRFYSEKLGFYLKHGPAENTAVCYHAMAGYYVYFADYDKAIGNYLRASDMYKQNFLKSVDPDGYANELQSIGTVYLIWGNLKKAEEYLKLSMNEWVRSKLIAHAFLCFHQLGDLYFKKGDYRQALKYYYEGKKVCMNEHYPVIFLALDFVSISAVHLQLGSRDSARIYLDSAEKIRQQEKFGISFSNGNIELDYTYFKYYLTTGNNKPALKSLEAALQQAQAAKYLPLILKYSDELHKYLLKLGDSLGSLRYLVMYHAIQDSLNKRNTQARIATFEIEQQQQQKEVEIQQLQTQKTTQRNYYLLAGALLLLIVLIILSRLRYKRKRDKEQLTSDFKKQLAQAETKALRAQMNPHFIFNSLNSINSFVMDQKHEIASDYLIKFSKLIRLILDNSRSETISIEKELETLKLYVLLEAARFDNRFNCVYHIAEDVETSSIMIPPMLLQPFVENAIWHGLMQKEGEGTITIEIKKQDEEFLNISITDNGIGREKAAEFKSKSATHKSHGLKVTSQRIEMMNRLNSSGAQVNIVDLKDEQGNATGTKVELIIPF